MDGDGEGREREGHYRIEFAKFLVYLSFLLMDLNEGILHVNTVLVYMGLRCFCAHRFLECISN